MRLNRITENPIEMIRINEKISQKEFAEKIGYSNKDQYAYNVKEFTLDIIQKIQAVYGINISMDIISYLKGKLRNQKKTIPNKTVQKNSNLNNNNPSNLLDLIK